MATINVSGNQVAGQSNNIIATGLNAADGDRFTWNTSNGSSFSPNPSTVGGGMTSTVYTPANAGLDTVSGSDSDSSDNTSTDVQVAAQGGGGGGGNPALTNASVIAAQAAMAQVQDFTSTAACGPVKAFQSAWNAAGGAPSLTVDGGYGVNTASASGAVAAANGLGGVQGGLSGGWPDCGGQVVPPPPVPPPVVASTGWPMWLRVVLWLIALGGAVGLGLWLWKTFGSSRPVAAASETKKTKTGKRKK